VISHSRLANGENGVPADLMATDDDFGWATVAIGDWDENGVGDFASSARGSNEFHIFLFDADQDVIEVITMSPDSDGYGYTAPASNSSWSIGLAFVGLEVLPGHPGVLGARFLVGQLTGEEIFDVLVSRNGTFSSTQRYTPTTPGLDGEIDTNYAFAQSLASADVDGDGYQDIISGAKLHGGNFQGAVYILFRNASNDVTSVTRYANGENGIPASTFPVAQRFGSHLAWIGDWGDGTNVLAVGSDGS